MSPTAEDGTSHLYHSHDIEAKLHGPKQQNPVAERQMAEQLAMLDPSSASRARRDLDAQKMDYSNIGQLYNPQRDRKSSTLNVKPSFSAGTMVPFTQSDAVLVNQLERQSQALAVKEFAQGNMYPAIRTDEVYNRAPLSECGRAGEGGIFKANTYPPVPGTPISREACIRALKAWLPDLTFREAAMTVIEDLSREPVNADGQARFPDLDVNDEPVLINGTYYYDYFSGHDGLPVGERSLHKWRLNEIHQVNENKGRAERDDHRAMLKAKKAEQDERKWRIDLWYEEERTYREAAAVEVIAWAEEERERRMRVAELGRKDDEYSVTFTRQVLGLVMETDFYGHSAVKYNMNDTAGVVGYFDLAHKGRNNMYVDHIQEGDMLVGINEQVVEGWSFRLIKERLNRTKSRPVVLHFRRPEAAGRTMNHYHNVLQTWGSPRMKIPNPKSPVQHAVPVGLQGIKTTMWEKVVAALNGDDGGKEQMTAQSMNERYITSEDLEAKHYGVVEHQKKAFELASPLPPTPAYDRRGRKIRVGRDSDGQGAVEFVQEWQDPDLQKQRMIERRQDNESHAHESTNHPRLGSYAHESSAHPSIRLGSYAQDSYAHESSDGTRYGQQQQQQQQQYEGQQYGQQQYEGQQYGQQQYEGQQYGQQ
jgi:hypothetical protein